MNQETRSTPRQRILVVDDEEINREILGAQLTSEGFAVAHAADGAAALSVIAAGTIDLVLTDVVMQPMDGYQLCHRIRDDLKRLDLPVIFITSLNDRDSRVRGKEAGCDDFLTKPVDSIELNARVQNLLRVKDYHDMRARQKEMLETELERTRGQLLRADRMATLGTLAAGVGHELNNILSVLQMTVELMRTRAAGGLPVRDTDLNRLNSVSEHVGMHARQLLNYGRPGPQNAERLDLRLVVRQTLDMLRIAGRLKLVELETQLPAEPVWVRANHTQLEQVLVNLVGNAVDAVLEVSGRARRVRVALTQSEPNADPKVPGARLALCKIEDNGCGIPADKMDAVFQPYYTTKPVGKGTGLGLAVVKNIVESCAGGRVFIESRAGEGTTVGFELTAIE